LAVFLNWGLRATSPAVVYLAFWTLLLGFQRILGLHLRNAATVPVEFRGPLTKNAGANTAGSLKQIYEKYFETAEGALTQISGTAVQTHVKYFKTAAV
jgi:hypothetical protein